jgi:succinate dehydrogenase/fumarate reductase-like Fe-S protein
MIEVEYDAETLHLMRHREREYRRANGGRASAEFLAACKGVCPSDVARALGRVALSGKSVCKLMREHKVTIAGLKDATGITMKRIRVVREAGLTDHYAIRDWLQAITGTDPGAALDHPAVEMLGF